MDTAIVDSTYRIYFTSSDASGGAIAPSDAFEAADIRIYKDGSATQRSSTAGWTMTSPFDSVTGLHLIEIDLSDNTDAGFYEAGSDYVVVLSPDTETVDGQTVVSVLGQFRIEAPSAAITFEATSVEPTAVPVLGSATLQEIVEWIALMHLTEINQTSSQTVVRDVADTTDVGVAAYSNDGATVVRGAFS